jgi:formate dehydrogenase maturation protein FdhE
MGTAVVRGGFTSIIRGEVSPAWAKLHHRLWYDRVTGKQPAHDLARRRIERAQELAKESPVLPELLEFYQQIARFQSTVAEGPPPANLEALLALIRRSAPDLMAQARAPAITWDDLLRSADPMHAFFARVLLQADAAARARRSPVATGVQPHCPFCAEKPVAAMLRPEGDGGKRFLLCGLCFTEWEYRRLLCPNCGEERQGKASRLHRRRVSAHSRRIVRYLPRLSQSHRPH